jgi:hypothetical protein
MIKKTFVLLMTLVLYGVGQAGAESSDKDSLILELYVLSGLKKQLQQVPVHAIASLQQDADKIPPQVHETLQRIVKESYNPELLQRSVIKWIDQHFDAERTKAVLAWLRDPFARKITNLEEDASTMESHLKMLEFAEKLEDHPPPKGRIELLRRLDEACRASEVTMDVVILTTWGVAIGVNAVLPKEQQMHSERMLQQMQAQRDMMIESIRQQTIVGALFTYQSLDDSELERYLAFAESDDGRWYHGLLGEALKGALLEASMKLGKTAAESEKDRSTQQKI